MQATSPLPAARLGAGILLACLMAGSSAGAQVVNEFVANHSGIDNHSFVEVSGTPNTDLSDHTVIEIQGDPEDPDDEPGRIGNLWPVGSTDSQGIWVSSYGIANGTGDIDNGTVTLLLVRGFSGTLGQDLDTNNDGVLDITPWIEIIDGVAVFEEAGDLAYTAVTLGPNFDGISTFPPGGASRIPNGVDTDSIGDWKRNDFDGEGLPGGPTGTTTAGEVENSPGAINTTGPLLITPKLDEIVIDHLGADTAERIEIWGEPSRPYSTVTVLVIDSDSTGTPGFIEHAFAVGSTNGSSMWSTPDLGTDAIGNQSKTILLVRDFAATAGTDLDADDDGNFDTTPWTEVFDDVAISDGAGADLFYSTVVVTPSFDGGTEPAVGLSRVPSGVDTDAVSDWVRNDFEGHGLNLRSGSATLDPGEAWNTPGRANRVREEDYWLGIDSSDASTLRSSIHARIDDHLRHAYSSSNADTWDILELADEDPLDDTQIVTIYKNETHVKFGGGDGPYNREHTWPQSYGFPDEALDNSPRTDAHHLFLANPMYNGARSNRPFGNCLPTCDELETLEHDGIGGMGGPYPGDSNWTTTDIFEVWSSRQGDVARALLYLDLRYEGGAHGASAFDEPDLALTDNTSLIVTTGGENSTGLVHMGRLSTLLAWHFADPVDERERRRNDIVWEFQGNRNPFIDHPEWAACVFQDLCTQDGIFADGFESGNLSAWSSSSQ